MNLEFQNMILGIAKMVFIKKVADELNLFVEIRESPYKLNECDIDD